MSEKTKLLELIATIELPSCEKFVAADEFRANYSDIKLWMSENFQKKFLGKIEENVEAATLRIHKLLQGSRDPEIIGGQEETTLYHLFTLLMKQAGGESGLLLTNGRANIFFIRDINGELWAVYMRWSSGDWCLLAYPVEDPDVWLDGFLFVFREAA